MPGPWVVELKSLKLYINGFRDRALSHEAAVNEVAETLVALLQPRRLRLAGRFTRRGNIDTSIVVDSKVPIDAYLEAVNAKLDDAAVLGR